MGRTNIVLDDELLEKCYRLTGIKTRRKLVDYALRELVRLEEQKKLTKLKGNIDWKGDLALWREGRQSDTG